MSLNSAFTVTDTPNDQNLDILVKYAIITLFDRTVTLT